MQLLQQTTRRNYFVQLAKDLGAPAESPWVAKEIQNAELALANVAGAQIWAYDDIGMLSGAAGLCLVRDGVVTKKFAVKRA